MFQNIVGTKKRSWLALATLTYTLSACALISEKYTYVPSSSGETPATIESSSLQLDKKALSVKAVLTKIDGKIIRTASQIFSIESTPPSYKISPGQHQITLVAYANGASKAIELPLTVKAGESYFLGGGVSVGTATTEGPNGILYGVWVEDSKHQRITGISFKVKTTYY